MRRLLRRVALFQGLCRTSPLSNRYGFDRGTPVDRHFIDHFLDEHRSDIRGVCLEVRDRRYTERFGSGVTSIEVVDVDASNLQATLHADLSAADQISSDRYDCFILTQTLQYVYDFHAAIREANRILRPGGVLLITVPGVARIDPTAGVGGDFWRFTRASMHRILGEAFDESKVEVRAYGNVLSATAFLMGLAAEELSRRELQYADERFPVLIAARAVKA